MFNTLHPYRQDIYANLDPGPVQGLEKEFEVCHRNMQEKMLQNPIFKDHNATFCDIITCMQAFSHLHILIIAGQ